MGLLYGNGDFTRTFEITTRCGDDADCNPASAGGILATATGFEKIPAYWKKGLTDVESIDFKYTTISLNDAYALSFKHALELIERNGGKVGANDVTIKVQKPKTVPLEVAFEGHYPKEQINLERTVTNETSFEFEGIGFVAVGSVVADEDVDYTLKAEISIDGKLVETVRFPSDFTTRRFYLFWKYQLGMAKHEVKVKVLNPTDAATLRLDYAITYGDQPQSYKF